MNFEVLEHTADIGVRAWGSTQQEMMANAGLAMVGIAMDLDEISEREAYPIAARGEDLESLLVNWLNEVLYYLDGRRIGLRRIEVQRCSTEEAAGIGWGEPRTEKHQANLVVKGVTYHQLKVEHRAGRWQCEVYLDI
ncbi:MAG TPA: archease [Bryobacteraceae bacterium]|nr:archease [Bryobacteraceae bacterium]